MDINDLRSAFTLVAFVSFIGIVVWAWSRNRATAFDAAACIPLNDDDRPQASQESDTGSSNE